MQGQGPSAPPFAVPCFPVSRFPRKVLALSAGRTQVDKFSVLPSGSTYNWKVDGAGAAATIDIDTTVGNEWCFDGTNTPGMLRITPTAAADKSSCSVYRALVSGDRFAVPATLACDMVVALRIPAGAGATSFANISRIDIKMMDAASPYSTRTWRIYSGLHPSDSHAGFQVVRVPVEAFTATDVTNDTIPVTFVGTTVYQIYVTTTFTGVNVAPVVEIGGIWFEAHALTKPVVCLMSDGIGGDFDKVFGYACSRGIPMTAHLSSQSIASGVPTAAQMLAYQRRGLCVANYPQLSADASSWATWTAAVRKQYVAQNAAALVAMGAHAAGMGIVSCPGTAAYLDEDDETIFGTVVPLHSASWHEVGGAFPSPLLDGRICIGASLSDTQTWGFPSSTGRLPTYPAVNALAITTVAQWITLIKMCKSAVGVFSHCKSNAQDGGNGGAWAGNNTGGLLPMQTMIDAIATEVDAGNMVAVTAADFLTGNLPLA